MSVEMRFRGDTVKGNQEKRSVHNESKRKLRQCHPMKEIRSTDDLLFPFPIYNELRSQGDIRYDETRKCWDLFRYADIQSVLKQPKVFSSQRGRSTSKTSILTMDPPKHTK